MCTHRYFSVALAAALFAGLASCGDAPTQAARQQQSRERAQTAEDELRSLRGAVLRLAPNEYSYSGFAADSLLESRARMAADDGDMKPLENLRAIRQRLRWPDDDSRQTGRKAIARVLVPGGDPSSPPPVIGPENTSPAVLYEATVKAEIRGTTGYVTGAMHYRGMSGGITLTRSAESVNPKYNVSEQTTRQDMMGDNAYDCIVVGTSICTFDEHSSRVVELRDLLPCGMTLKGSGSFVAYWGLPQGNGLSARGPFGGVSFGQWGYSTEVDAKADDAKSESDCTAPKVVMDVRDADGRGTATAGGTLNVSVPQGAAAALLILDGRQSNPGNSDVADYTWRANDVAISSGAGTSVASYSAPIGTTTITLTVTNKAALSTTGSVKVVVTENPADPPPGQPGGGGGGPTDLPPPPPNDPPGIYCWEVYHLESWFDYNTFTGGTIYVVDGVECEYADRVPTAAGAALTSKVAGSSGVALATTAAASGPVMIVATDSLPNGRAFAAVRRARRDQPDLLLVNTERLTEADLDFGLRLARSARARLVRGASDVVLVPRGSTPALSDAARIAAARGLVASLRRAPVVDVPGFGRRRAITIDLATRHVVP